MQSSNDLQLLINNAYAIMGNRGEAEFVSVFTDEASIGFANGGQGESEEFVFFMNPGSFGPDILWERPYLALARLNRVIQFADKITPANADDAKKIQNLKAQALTLRAYAHLIVLSYFTTDMKNDSALAGIIADRIFAAEENDFPRNTNGEFYTFIHKDLTDAIALFNSAGLAVDSNYANINFAKGLKARAFAYKGDYVNAEIWANDVINSSAIPLATKTQYRTLFFSETPAQGVEILFKFNRTPQQNSQATNLHNAWASVRPSAAGSPFYEVSRALHNKLNPGNLAATTLATAIPDVRANVIISPTSTIDPGYATSPNVRDSDRIIINKHGGTLSATTNTWASTATNANNNSFKIMRISEMYMIKAEARANAGDLAGAAAAIKVVRDARFGAPQTVATPASATAAWKMILDERRIEFAYEGFRFLDIKRLGKLANSGIDRDPADYASSTLNYPGGNPANMPLDSYKWALPIPDLETNVNTMIQQNPGY